METLLPQNGLINACPLTKSEREILQTARDNGTLKDPLIAATLSKSPDTAENQWKEIKRKLEVIERYAAICVAEDAGWLALNPRTITRSGGGINSPLPPMHTDCFYNVS
jgi:DNA-binding NarL/FixJ family response regulator